MRLAAALAAAVALTACGDDGDPEALDVVRAAKEALADVRAFHIEGRFADPESEFRFRGDIAPGRTRVRFEEGEQVATALVLGDRTYLRGNRAFWVQNGSPGALAGRVAGRWVGYAMEEAGELTEQMSPATLARCLDDRLGTLNLRGESEVDQEPVEVVVDRGDKPGTAPGILYVSTEEPRLPLRLTQTGPRSDGGPPAAEGCDDGDDTTVEADVRLSRFDEPVRIREPAGAPDLDAIIRELESVTTT